MTARPLVAAIDVWLGMSGTMARLTLKPEFLRWSINHILAHGDTDIFPPPFELTFVRECRDNVLHALSEINLYTYQSAGIIQSLFPKNRYGFRLAHQLHPIDTILLTAALGVIGRDLEKARIAIEEHRAYAYRFSPNAEGGMFSDQCKYSDWLDYQYMQLTVFNEYKFIITADIADFYQRIYHHRLENCLNDYVSDPGRAPYAKFIFRMIKDYNVRESFGLPVGGNVARLLAEVALCDTDKALKNHGYQSTRYVDDFVVFIKEYDDPYGALAFLAEHLATNEGLSLNGVKTCIVGAEKYIAELESVRSSRTDEDAVEFIYHRAYDSEELDEDAIADLHAIDLIGELDREMSRDIWDGGRIRILLRSLRLTKTHAAADFVRQHFRELLPFVKDVVLLLNELAMDGDQTFADWGNDVVALMMEPASQRLEGVRAWLLELFIRDVVTADFSHLKRVDSLNGTLDMRQLMLLRSKAGDVNFFRGRKKRFIELNDWVKPAFIYGAQCLPADEYMTWVRHIRGRVSFPLSDMFCDWVLAAK